MTVKDPYLRKIESLLPRVLAVDRAIANRELRRLLTLKDRSRTGQKSRAGFERLLKRLQTSEKKRNRRRDNLPDLQFSGELPIFAKKDEIVQAIADHPVIVVSGETGSGKTTQLPKFCLAAGRGVDGIIGCTQPRRIAATTVARRVAAELDQDLGQAVGYKIRFKDRTPKDGYIKFMTDGILLAETPSDPLLNAYDTIIVDEAHERSLNIDFILGILQTLVTKRDDLKLIITSATIDTGKFSKAFNNAPVIEVSGRLYPVEVEYLDADSGDWGNGDATHVDLAAGAVRRILNQTRRGDILVFMPTEQDIRETCDLIETQKPAGCRVLPLFARLTAAEQKRVFARLSQRKIIVATNVAETSITIPGIKYVIDSGLARISRYSPRTRTTSLPVLPVSKSSADQRKGRCGRVEDGICIRLFSEDDYQARPQYTPPEIIRANLADVILRMISLKLGDIAEFPFIDRPDFKSIKDGFNLLFELGAIKKRPKDKDNGRLKDKGKRIKAKHSGHRGADTQEDDAGAGKHGRGTEGVGGPRNAVVLTAKGRIMAKIPLDPRLSRMLIEAQKEQCVAEIAVIAAALSIQDPRERPAEKTREADRMHALFDDPNSDFVTLLNLWIRYHARWKNRKSNNQMKRYCREHYLSFKRMREWRDIHGQIRDILAEHGTIEKKIQLKVRDANYDLDPANSTYRALHNSILSGFLSNIAMKKDKYIFRAGKGREVMIFPGSGLFNTAKSWVVAAEVVETSRVFARTVANIDNDWLEDLGRDLCKYAHLDPHWEKNRGQVVATEQVSLFGLIIVPERKISYGKVNPAEARDIFIQSALISQDVKNPFAFMKHNQELVDGIVDIENRVRRRDILISEQELFQFYKERLPLINDMRTLSRYLKKKGNDRFLRMKRADLMQYDPNQSELSQFPDRLKLGGLPLKCDYSFEPGEEKDGVTVHVPSSLAPSIPAEAFDWLVPGLYPEKVEGLIKGLPKAYRKKLVPVKDTAAIICREMTRTGTSLVSALGKFIYSRFNVDIPASAWAVESLPDHLKMRISVTDSGGKVLRAGRDVSILRQDGAGIETAAQFESLRQKWEKSAVTRWDFGDLPDFLSDTGGLNARWIAYPALEKDPATVKQVNLRLFQQKDKALAAHQEGVVLLYGIHFSKDLKFLKRQLSLPAVKSHLADYFGGAKQFRTKLYNAILQTLFAKNIRSQKAFYDHAELTGPKILSCGREMVQHVLPVLTAYHETRSEIYNFQKTVQRNSRLVEYMQEIIQGLLRLVPENFVELYETDRFPHLERYIKATLIRAQRARVDFEKDQAKAREIQGFAEGLNRQLKELAPAASAEKRQEIEEYFWMLEEYKVSIFAQELKTAFPVSAKRLKDKLGQIERMV